MFATTTGERLAEAFTQSHGHAGVYNRMLFTVAETEIPPKRYTGQRYEIPAGLAGALARCAAPEMDALTLDTGAFAAWVEVDRDSFEPLKRKDPALGGRLGEQAIKLAGLIALSHERTAINAADVEIAAEIRLALYRRMHSFVEACGGIAGDTPLARASDQLAEALERHKQIPVSKLKNFSRVFAGLDLRERKVVLTDLQESGRGFVVPAKRSGKVLVAPELCE